MDSDGFRIFLRQADDFRDLCKRSTCAIERRRGQLLALLCEGKSYAEVLEITRYSYQGADKIVDTHGAQGLERLKDQRHGFRSALTLLSDADLLLLAQTIPFVPTSQQVAHPATLLP
jgi:hypothetical protein